MNIMHTLERKKIIDLLIVVMTMAMVVTSVFALWQIRYQMGFNAAKSLVEHSSFGAIMMSAPDDIRILSGTVTAVGSDRIMVHTVSNNPFDTLSDRTVLVASSTKITKFAQKDSAVSKSEMDAYTKAIESKAALKGASSTTPPLSFTIAVITTADINVGDMVMITAPDNIKSLRTFTASFIQVKILPPHTPGGSLTL